MVVVTRRGHGCLPFSPAVRAFVFIARRVQRSHFSAVYARFSSICCKLTLSDSDRFTQEKVPMTASGCGVGVCLTPFSQALSSSVLYS